MCACLYIYIYTYIYVHIDIAAIAREFQYACVFPASYGYMAVERAEVLGVQGGGFRVSEGSWFRV